MKNRAIILVILLLVCCTAKSQVTAFFVKPFQTDAAYAVPQDSHYVAVNPAVTNNGKLVLFIGGTGSQAKNYTAIPRLAANLGFHAISIAYPNSIAAAQACAGSPDSLCFDSFRQEICYGTPVSSKVAVDTLNSISIRLVRLLQYLSVAYPFAGWDQFLSGGLPVWSNIAVAGHSQGSGHALYFANTQPCNRALLFSGANDYSVYYSRTAHWIRSSFQTSKTGIFSFLNLYDEVESYSSQYEVLKSLGMLAADDSTLVDTKQPPYGNSHCLYTKAQSSHPSLAATYHNSTSVDYFAPIGTGEFLFNPVWTYMLTSSPATFTAKSNNSHAEFLVFPNPSMNIVTVQPESHDFVREIQVISLSGQTIRQMNTLSSRAGVSVSINLEDIPAGCYFIRLSTDSGIFTRRFVKINP